MPTSIIGSWTLQACIFASQGTNTWCILPHPQKLDSLALFSGPREGGESAWFPLFVHALNAMKSHRHCRHSIYVSTLLRTWCQNGYKMLPGPYTHTCIIVANNNIVCVTRDLYCAPLNALQWPGTPEVTVVFVCPPIDW